MQLAQATIVCGPIGFALLSLFCFYLASGVRMVKQRPKPISQGVSFAQTAEACENFAGEYWSDWYGPRDKLYVTQSGCSGRCSGKESFQFNVSAGTLIITGGEYDGTWAGIDRSNTLRWSDETTWYSTTSTQSNVACLNFAGEYWSDWYGPRDKLYVTQSGCSGRCSGKESFQFNVSLATLIITGGEWDGTWAAVDSCNTLMWSDTTTWYHTKEASDSGSLPSVDFNLWMDRLASSSVPQGGYACGYGDGWCGCSCGHNMGNSTPCFLPAMQPGTMGGHTCGYYGNLYGCAEAHNTLEGCPRTSASLR